MKTPAFATSFVCLFAVGLASAAEVESWPQWRGPQNSGSIEGGKYPAEWTKESVLWSLPLPGKGCSTPIVWNGTIFLTAPIEGRDALLAIDLEGKPLWQVKFGNENPGKHRNGSGCNASPATDGTNVYVYFKSGVLAAVGLDGTIRWQTNLVERFGPATLFWDHGTSPVLTENYVIMARMHKGESWLAAFDKATGEMKWKVPRNYKTPVEGDHGYSTPVVIQHEGKESLLVWGAEHLTIHSVDNGDVLWTCGDFNPDSVGLWPAIATPVISGNMAVIAYGRNDKGAPRLHGIRLDGEGDVTKTNRVWQQSDFSTFVPTPVAYQGKVYLVGDHGRVTCLDPETGETAWSGSFGRSRAKFYASPLIAGEKLYAAREDGVVFVADIQGELKVLAEIDMGESIIASPVPVANRLLIRSTETLYCIAGE